MTPDASALFALKNAWNGVLNASDRLRELAPGLDRLPADSQVSALDLETYHRAALAQANAAMALRGLLEQLRGKQTDPS